jgi:hypothetical protein
LIYKEDTLKTDCIRESGRMKNTFLFRRRFILYWGLAVCLTVVSCPSPSVAEIQIVPESSYYYVASWGDDTWFGKDEKLPFRTLAHTVKTAASDLERSVIIILSDLSSTSEAPGGSGAVFEIGGSGSKEIILRGRGRVNLNAENDSRPCLFVRGGVFTLEDITLTKSLSAGLVVEGASRITGRRLNCTENSLGADIRGGSFFTLEDGVISQNSNGVGPGGVYVSGGGSFVMKGAASVKNNTGTTGGVSVVESSFTMTDNASVSGNFGTAQDSGGGVYLYKSSMRMDRTASISFNEAGGLPGGILWGSGVFMDEHSSLILAGSSLISRNPERIVTAPYAGSGVTMKNSSELVLRETSQISFNSGDAGSGVWMGNNCGFTMEGHSTMNLNGIMSKASALWAENSCRVRLRGGSTITNTPGLYIDASSLIMEENAKMRQSNNDWGAVKLVSGASFVMKDNTDIQYFISMSVQAKSGSSFTMGGRARITRGDWGVLVEGGSSFTMDGEATIEEIRSTGVIVKDASRFTLDGSALITGCGVGAVHVSGTGEFIMENGRISGNVCGPDPVHRILAFADHKGHGGGVALGNWLNANADSPTFIMKGGVISANEAYCGGGVSISVKGATFIKQGGFIYGADWPDAAARNIGNKLGAAVYVPDTANAAFGAIAMENTLPDTKNLSGGPPYDPNAGWSD